MGAITTVCSDAQFGYDVCPAASQIGTAKMNTPLLPSEMSRVRVCLLDKASFKFGYILRGPRTAYSMVRGSASPDHERTQVDFARRSCHFRRGIFSSATFNFTSQLIVNPPYLQTQFAYANIVRGERRAVNDWATANTP